MAKKDEIAQKLEQLLPKDAICRDDQYRSGVALAAQVPMDKLREAISLCRQADLYLEAITGMDFTDGLEIVYHLNCYEPHSRIALRVRCNHGDAPATISDVYSAAIWYEREVHEFFAVSFKDNPDLRRLLLPEDADYYPHLKSFGKVHSYRKWEEVYG
jgi:NADH-quinone oxidoreductase subunit C